MTKTVYLNYSNIIGILNAIIVSDLRKLLLLISVKMLSRIF